MCIRIEENTRRREPVSRLYMRIYTRAFADQDLGRRLRTLHPAAKAGRLVVTERLDRVEAGGLPGRVHPGDQTHAA